MLANMKSAILTARLNSKKVSAVEWWEPICYSLIFQYWLTAFRTIGCIKDVPSLKILMTHIIFITLQRELRRPEQSLKNGLVLNKYLTTNTVTLVLQGCYYFKKFSPWSKSSSTITQNILH